MLRFVWMNSLIGTKEAAAILNISVRRVQVLIASGRIPAKKIGNSYAINESDLTSVNERTNGRPTNSLKAEDRDWNALIDKFAGCIKGGPPDLSTNKKHMEGFGRDKTGNW